MGTVIIPVVEGLEVLVVRTLAVLGIGAVANEGAKVLSQSKTSECAETGNQTQCNQCRLKEGFIGYQPRYVTRSNRINYDYQLYIANLHAGPERFTYVNYGDNSNTPINIDWSLTKEAFGKGGKYTTTEWCYGGVWFDGFWRSRCTVLEAKANYEDAWDDDGAVVKPWIAQKEVSNWVTKAYPKQQAAIATASPQGRLEWHFMQLVPYRKAISAGLPETVARLTPMLITGH